MLLRILLSLLLPLLLLLGLFVALLLLLHLPLLLLLWLQERAECALELGPFARRRTWTW